MDDPDNAGQYMQMAQTNIRYLLQGETPRLIDEWQTAPKFWDAIRYEVDHREGDGQTAKATPTISLPRKVARPDPSSGRDEDRKTDGLACSCHCERCSNNHRQEIPSL